jgi:TonB family protein
MRDRTGKVRAASHARAAAFDELSNDERAGREELELRALLACWQVPGAASASLRARLSASYRQQFAQQKEETMKAYGMPHDSFGAGYACAGADFQLTILEQESLPRRLFAEVSQVARDSRLTRDEFRRDPLGFAHRLLMAYARMTRRALAQENVGYGLLASLAVVLTLVGAVVALDHSRSRGLLAARTREDLIFLGMADVPKEQPQPDAAGAGMASAGHGGGQKAKLEKPGGGGGGGRLEDKPAVNGKLPQATLDQQVLAPDPKPPAIQHPSLPTAATIRADPVLFPPDPRAVNYGDPKSKATELSSGSGSGNGIGDGTGGGVGSGNGTGYGAGDGFNTGGGPAHVGGAGPGAGGGSPVDYDRVFNVREVTRRASILSRPEPLYTEEARRNQLTGTVTLRLVLNANGTVTNVVAITRLPDGLTEKAMEAARQIKFTPAEKDGRRVSQYATINYNFNIY